MKIKSAVLVLSLTTSVQPAFGDCAFSPDGAEISIAIKSCEMISPESKEDLKQILARNPEQKELYYRLFTGARIEDEQGLVWVYPTTDPDACTKFSPGAIVKKAVFRSCCDTGRWGKCALGGRFLGDIGGRPLDASQ